MTRPSNSRLAEFHSTSTTSRSSPATASTSSNPKTRSTSRPCGSWATCTMPWRAAATRATNWSGSGPRAVLPVRRGHRHLRPRCVHAVPREPHAPRRLRPRSATGPAVPGAEHAAGKPAEEPARRAGRPPVRQRRAVRRDAGLRRLQPRHAEPAAGLHASSIGAGFRPPCSGRCSKP